MHVPTRRQAYRPWQVPRSTAMTQFRGCCTSPLRSRCSRQVVRVGLGGFGTCVLGTPGISLRKHGVGLVRSELWVALVFGCTGDASARGFSSLTRTIVRIECDSLLGECPRRRRAWHWSSASLQSVLETEGNRRDSGRRSKHQ